MASKHGPAMIGELRSKIANGQFEFSKRDREANDCRETFVDGNVTYPIELGGKFILVENVPARVCVATGERFFSPEDAHFCR